MPCPDSGHLRGLTPPWNPGHGHKVSCTCCPSLRIHGLTSPWTLSQAYPPSKGNTVILVLVNRFSKACKFVALPKLPCAKETVELLLQHVYSDNPSSWAEYLPWVEYAHHTLWQSSLGMSPFEHQFGFSPPMFTEEEHEVGVSAAEQFVQRCRRVWRMARASLLATTEARKQVADCKRRPAPSFWPGQRVLLSAKDLPLCVDSKKLAPRYVGPFKVDRHINLVTYRLHLPPSMRIHPAFHMSCLRPFLCGTRPPALHLVAGSPAYTVHWLLDSCYLRAGIQYLLNWDCYRSEERSWVLVRHILDPELIRELRRTRTAGLGTSGAVPRRGGPLRHSAGPACC
ncbi:hypothetical protein MHYP_G00011670 [Metynnis hypsauchen]